MRKRLGKVQMDPPPRIASRLGWDRTSEGGVAHPAVRIQRQVRHVDGGSSLYARAGPAASGLCILEIDGEKIIFPPTPRLVKDSEPLAAQIILAAGDGDSLHEQILAPEELINSSPSCILILQKRQCKTRQRTCRRAPLNHLTSRAKCADLLGLASAAGAEELLRASFQLKTPACWR